MQSSGSIRVRAPGEMREAVKSAAAAKYLSASAYIRQAVADRLERDGFSDPPAKRDGVQLRSAGSR